LVRAFYLGNRKRRVKDDTHLAFGGRFFCGDDLRLEQLSRL